MTIMEEMVRESLYMGLGMGFILGVTAMYVGNEIRKIIKEYKEFKGEQA